MDCHLCYMDLQFWGKNSTRHAAGAGYAPNASKNIQMRLFSALVFLPLESNMVFISVAARGGGEGDN